MNKVVALSILLILIVGGWMFSPGTGVPILAYHQVQEAEDLYSVPPAQFEEQMDYLKANGYHAISLEELFMSYEGQAVLPSKPIIITFDDGYEDNFLNALPIMEKYHMRGTVFVAVGLVGTPEYLSWQQILEMQKRHTEIGSHTMNHIGLGSVDAAKQQTEVVESKAMLEKQIGKSVKFLAYPYGEFTSITQQIVKAAGYQGACTGVAGLNKQGTDAYALKRVNVPHPKYGLWEFRLRLLRANLYTKLGI